MGRGAGLAGAAGAVLAAEICAPLLLLCGLCCWPDDDRSDTSSQKSKKGKHPQKPVVSRECSGCGGSSLIRRRSRGSSSAVSLHQPSTSGQSKELLSSHRSHEEIGRRHSHLTATFTDTDDGRYHSAPSVIDEVLQRRSWQRSTDLHLASVSPPPCPAQSPPPPCKKHHTNIKSSRNRTDKEAVQDEVKDTDATETDSQFYIGDVGDKIRSVYRAKEAKQSFNEYVKWEGGEEGDGLIAGRCCRPDRTSLLLACATPETPPPSIEAVGYEGGACYLAETGVVGELRLRPTTGGAGGLEPLRGPRARHASDGDILAPTVRPESGAFSESDLELELENAQLPATQPPPSSKLPSRRSKPTSDGTETAI